MITRSVSFRQNGVHTLGEKIVDTSISNISSYHYGGPQFQYSNGKYYLATEYYWITGERRDGYTVYDDYSAEEDLFMVNISSIVMQRSK